MTSVSGDAGAKRRVLLTGAAGRIGAAFRRHVGDHYALRLADRPGATIVDPDGHETVAFDIADPEGCRRACVGVDTVVHLAADPAAGADFHGSLLDNNIKGTYNVFRAAADAGCRRVVFASSVFAVDGYPADAQIGPADPVWPPNMYGVSKCFGEATARYFAGAEGLSAICVRIGAYDYNPERQGRPVTSRVLSIHVSPRDLNDLLVRCVETPGIQFAIVHGVSDNRFKRLDITSARELLGYAPQDDAFRHFGVVLPE